MNLSVVFLKLPCHHRPRRKWGEMFPVDIWMVNMNGKVLQLNVRANVKVMKFQSLYFFLHFNFAYHTNKALYNKSSRQACIRWLWHLWLPINAWFWRYYALIALGSIVPKPKWGNYVPPKATKYPKNQALKVLGITWHWFVFLQRCVFTYRTMVFSDSNQCDLSLLSPHCDWCHNFPRDVTLPRKKW